MTDSQPPANTAQLNAMTARGILITFFVCNLALLAAVAIGFLYTLALIRETNASVNAKIDRSYAAWAEFGKTQEEKISAMTDEIKTTNKIICDTLGITLEDFTANRKEIYEKFRATGKEALMKFISQRAASPATAPGAPAAHGADSANPSSQTPASIESSSAPR